MTTKKATNGLNLLSDGMSNKKIRKTIQINRAHIVTFSLPAVVTCPSADKCLIGGYCTAGNYKYPSVEKKQFDNYTASQSSEFVDMICAELSEKWTYSKYVRIHPTGDFYNVHYLKKWVEIAVKNPDIIFYAYTKSIRIVKGYADKYGLPSNLIITYSFGSKDDILINPDKDRYAVVIGPNDECPAGYVNGSLDDLVMVKGAQKIALNYHHPNIKWEKSGFYGMTCPQ